MTHAENGEPGAGEVDVLARLGEVEAEAHQAGWDGPPSLSFLGADGVLYVALDPVPNPPVEALMVIAKMLATPKLPYSGVLRATVEVDPVAVIFVCEAWQNEQFPTEQDRMRDPRPLADIPGSVEIRVACAVGLDGQRYWVNRVRGSEPTTHNSGPSPDDWQVSGRVFDALTDIAELVRAEREKVAS